jgi:hypothetical protein
MISKKAIGVGLLFCLNGCEELRPRIDPNSDKGIRVTRRREADRDYTNSPLTTNPRLVPSGIPDSIPISEWTADVKLVESATDNQLCALSYDQMVQWIDASMAERELIGRGYERKNFEYPWKRGGICPPNSNLTSTYMADREKYDEEYGRREKRFADIHKRRAESEAEQQASDEEDDEREAEIGRQTIAMGMAMMRTMNPSLYDGGSSYSRRDRDVDTSSSSAGSSTPSYPSSAPPRTVPPVQFDVSEPPNSICVSLERDSSRGVSSRYFKNSCSSPMKVFWCEKGDSTCGPNKAGSEGTVEANGTQSVFSEVDWYRVCRQGYYYKDHRCRKWEN